MSNLCLLSVASPLTSVSGKAHYTAQFQALRSYFHSYKPIEWQVISHNDERLVLDCLVHWQLSSWGLSTQLRQITLLSFSPEDGKIVAHEDIWSWTDMLKAVPLFGRLYTRFRPFFGRVGSNWMIRRFTDKKEGVFAQPFAAQKDTPDWVEVPAGHDISDAPEDFGVSGNAAKIAQRGTKANQNLTSRATSSKSVHKEL